MRLETAILDIIRQQGLESFDHLVEALVPVVVNSGLGFDRFVEELDRLKKYLQEQEPELNDDLFQQIRSALLGKVTNSQLLTA